MTQKAYLRKVLQKFDIGCEIKFVSTLLAPYFKISANMSPKTVDEHEYMFKFHMPVLWVVLCIL